MRNEPDNATREVRNKGIEAYEVVRVASEVVVDLIGSACGIDFQEAQAEIGRHDFECFLISFASVKLLLKTGQTVREKDETDRLHLKRLLANPINFSFCFAASFCLVPRCLRSRQIPISPDFASLALAQKLSRSR